MGFEGLTMDIFAIPEVPSWLAAVLILVYSIYGIVYVLRWLLDIGDARRNILFACGFIISSVLCSLRF